MPLVREWSCSGEPWVLLPFNCQDKEEGSSPSLPGGNEQDKRVYTQNPPPVYRPSSFHRTISFFLALAQRQNDG